MKHPRHILVIVDPTAVTHPAIDKAMKLAEQFQARLELFICDPNLAQNNAASSAISTEPEPVSPLLKAHRDMLEVLAHSLRRSGLEIITDVAWTNPLYAGLLHKITSAHADLVVKDTHYHPLVGRTLFTNTDWQLIRSCPVPLLLAKSTEWSNSPRIVAAVDPGHFGDKPAVFDYEIIEWGATLAEQLHGELHAVHAYVPSQSASGSSSTLGAEAVEQDHSQMEQLNALLWSCDIPKERLHLVHGVASEVLPTEATRLNASIVVIGAVSRSTIKRIFIGSTAETVLDRLPCDMLIVKPFSFACELPF